MRVLTSDILTSAKIWLLILAVAIASLALAPGSRPADATGGTEIYFTFSLTTLEPETNIVSTADGPPLTVYVWAKNPKDPDWGSGVGAYEVDFQYDPTRVSVTTAEYDQCGLDHNADDDGDLRDNDGCPAVGSPETGSQCSVTNHIDDDGDGFVNDGCPQVGDVAEINQCANAVDDDGDGFVNDGCAAVGAAEVDECANALDDDGDGRINNGCPMAAPPAETGALCLNNLDDEGGRDGFVNDGCPQRPEEGTECDDALDNDGDGAVNDGCPTDAVPESGAECANATDDDGDGFINDGCPPDGSESGTQCDNSADDDGDGTVNDGCPQVDDAEEGTDCANAVDDDSDGKVNDGCPETSSSEAGAQCLDAVDEDGDGLVNDGCLARGVAESSILCHNSTDDDGDTIVNDGCPAAGTKEGSGQCGNAVDDDGDTVVNDGCPQLGNPELNQCGNTEDDDGDTVVNDGCPGEPMAVGPAEIDQCANVIDDDFDSKVNDGCPQVGPEETGSLCGNDLDDDGDTVVNDGCPQRGSVFVGNPSWLGLSGRGVSCGTAYTREVAGSSPLRWHVNFSCTSIAPPDQGVQVSGLLGTFTLRPGTPFGIGPLAFTGATNLNTPGHVKDINPPDGTPDTIKEPTELPATVRSAQWRIARCGDRTGDRYIAFSDFLVLVTNSGTVAGPPESPGWDPGNDLNDDGSVGFIDFLVMLGWSSRTC